MGRRAGVPKLSILNCVLMKHVTIIGMGLIGGSFYKAAEREGFKVTGIDKNDQVDVTEADIIIIALSPALAVGWLRQYGSAIKDGAIVIDTCGIKQNIYNAFSENRNKRKWYFIPGHPMAGKEVSGFANSDANLFSKASMIVTPYPDTPAQILEEAFAFLLKLGFKKIVTTTPEHHDEMIAYTSQLCHIISSAYVREELSAAHDGFSAGSFRDMVRVGAPDPALWTELFDSNSDALLPILDRYIGRLTTLRDAIASHDKTTITEELQKGSAAKLKIRHGEKPL